MVGIELVSRRLTDIALNNTGERSEEKYDIVRYGLHLLLSDTIKLMIFLIIAHFLGIIFYVVISLISFGLLRTFAGGIHAKTWLGCLITNMVFIFGVVYLSFFLGDFSHSAFGMITIAICYMILFLYAPADHETKPILSKKQRKRLKMTAILVFTIIAGISLFLLHGPLSNMVLLSAFIECIVILPSVYKITKNSYGSTSVLQK